MDIQSLTKFYDRLYSDGKCSHYQECSKECKFQLNFYRGRIGSHYGEGIPKIFIVGREPVFPKNYNGEKISYSVTEPCTLADAGYNDHYLRTFYTVAQLTMKDNLPKSYQKNDMIDYENVRHNFFFTNFFKCVFTDTPDRTNKSESPFMCQNCGKILLKEIELLKPDIVILQGKAYGKIWDLIDWHKDEPLVISEAEVHYPNRTCKYQQGLYKAELKNPHQNHSFLIIDSYHPTSHGIWTTKEVFEDFNLIIKEALKVYNGNKAE